MISEALRTQIVFWALALLAAAALSALIVIAQSVRSIAIDARKIHLQQGNIVAMLLRAGFRPARGKADWFDNSDETQHIGESRFDTQVNPFAPWHRDS